MPWLSVGSGGSGVLEDGADGAAPGIGTLADGVNRVGIGCGGMLVCQVRYRWFERLTFWRVIASEALLVTLVGDWIK